MSSSLTPPAHHLHERRRLPRTSSPSPPPTLHLHEHRRHPPTISSTSAAHGLAAAAKGPNGAVSCVQGSLHAQSEIKASIAVPFFELPLKKHCEICYRFGICWISPCTSCSTPRIDSKQC
ncbi:hypothetical protein BS78_01G461800 [Paspalum vaginatum]|nr:hypothetical protein BS78_01G461800 [Paspalum vaginatum]KAJ1298544.1 hypothetical protein BS78_01G461800 [Paspalum vaginatum]